MSVINAMSVNMNDILNKRFALRKLLTNKALHETTESIDKALLTQELEPQLRPILAILASQLLKEPDTILLDTYDLTERRKDWLALTNKVVLDEANEILKIDTRSRPGHKILDHHMPHFYDVKNYKGQSVKGLFTQAALEKALITNLAMHTTPYKSEIRRMLTMTGGLGNVTKYRTVTAKALVQFYGAKRVLDPCAGWGGRLLGCLAGGAEYVGYEPDPNTAQGLRDILADPAIPESIRSKCIINEECFPTGGCAPPAPQDTSPVTGGLGGQSPPDMVLTSPPYFNLEVYTAGQQSINEFPTWELWTEKWLKPVILTSLASLKEGGVSCWSVKNFKSDKHYPLADVTKQIHEAAGWTLVKTVKMTGSARPGGNRINEETGKEKRGSEEETFCFKKI
jgi:hypothetical protein